MMRRLRKSVGLNSDVIVQITRSLCLWAAVPRQPRRLNTRRGHDSRGTDNLDGRGQAAPSSVRYLYNVARLTPRYLAMSLPVCPSAIIRFAVAMCSESSTL